MIDTLLDPNDPGPLRAAEPTRTLRQALLHYLVDLARVLAVNALIGVGLHYIQGMRLADCMVYSQAIGLSIYAFAMLLTRLFGTARALGKALLIAVPLGCLLGIALGSLITGDGLLASAHGRVGILVAPVLLALLIGSGASYYFYSLSLLSERQALLKQAELARALVRQRLGEAQLKMLQAQIEPHFLFNTLSNVISLIDERPQDARRMLVDLTQLLRRSLLRARADSLPLAEEMSDIHAYLDIQKHRMGPRLRYWIEVDPELESTRIAPYLVQPLVENAIRHGLEPQIDGGELRISARRRGEQLLIEVADTGRGLRSDQAPGVALANIRARLSAMYGTRGELSLHPNAPAGVVSRLVLPLAPA